MPGAETEIVRSRKYWDQKCKSYFKTLDKEAKQDLKNTERTRTRALEEAAAAEQEARIRAKAFPKVRRANACKY